MRFSKFAKNSPESDLQLKQASNPPILMIVGVKEWSLFLDSSVQSPIFCAQRQSLLVIGPIRAAYCYIIDFLWPCSCVGRSLAAFSPSPNT